MRKMFSEKEMSYFITGGYLALCDKTGCILGICNPKNKYYWKVGSPVVKFEIMNSGWAEYIVCLSNIDNKQSLKHPKYVDPGDEISLSVEEYRKLTNV